jgi:regulator of protease activity HflC (stomatin/prohibitin superfamily)
MTPAGSRPASGAMFHVYQHGTLIGKSASLWGAVGISQRYSTYSFADACRFDGISVVSPEGEAIEPPQHARKSFVSVKKRSKAERKALAIFHESALHQ